MNLILRHLVCLSILSCTSCWAEYFTCEGIITKKTLAHGLLQTNDVREFIIHVESDQWEIISHHINNLPDASIYQTSCDSSNVYFVTTFDTNTPAMVAVYSQFQNRIKTNWISSSKFRPVNKAVAVVFPGIFPDPVSGDIFAMPLWLAFGSANYLALQPNKTLPPPFFIAPEHDHRLTEMRMKSSWICNLDQLALPQSVTYFNDGFYYALNNGKFEKRPHESPYQKGFTNAFFKVTIQTNIGGLMFPLSFEFTHFAPAMNGTDETQLLVIEQYNASTKKITISKDSTLNTATLPINALVRDSRTKTKDATGVVYFSTNGKWLSTNEAIEVGQKTHNSQNSTSVPSSTPKKTALFVRLVLMLIFLTSLIVLYKLSKFGKNKK